MDEAYLSSLAHEIDPCSTVSSLIYTSELYIDLDTGELNCDDPRAYAAKFKTYDDDNISFNIALSGNYAGEWKDDMVNEIQGLLRQDTWKSLPRSLVPKDKYGNDRTILPGTLAFKLKRLPDGSPLKFKA